MKKRGKVQACAGQGSCEAVGIFADVEQLKHAIDELLAAGFTCDDFGLLAGEHTVQQKLGGLYSRLDAVADPSHPADAAFVRSEAVDDTTHGLTGGLFFVGGTAAMGALVASSAILGGPLAVAVAGAVAVGAVGALVEGIIAKSDADYLREQVDLGRVLLFVRRLGDPARRERARDILSRHAAAEVKLYALPEQGAPT